MGALFQREALMVSREKFLVAAHAFLAKLPTTFKPQAAVACPHCEAKGVLLIYAIGSTHGDDGALVHEMPACAEFVEKEPCDFMEGARLKLQAQVMN